MRLFKVRMTVNKKNYIHRKGNYGLFNKTINKYDIMVLCAASILNITGCKGAQEPCYEVSLPISFSKNFLYVCNIPNPKCNRVTIQ